MSMIPQPRSPLWLVILALVCEAPMHPYRMQFLIKQRGKDLVANVAQRNSVYQTIDALQRAGLIAVRETERDERRPEKTIYEATDLGRIALAEWVRTGIAVPAREFPAFPAAIATLYGLADPVDFARLLEERIEAQSRRITELTQDLPDFEIPRIFIIEHEFLVTMLRAEIDWLRGLVADLRSGRLTYPSEEEVRALIQHLEPSES